MKVCKKCWPFIIGSVLVIFSVITVIEARSSVVVAGTDLTSEVHIALSTIVESVLGLLLAIIGFFIVRQLNKYDDSISELGTKISHLDASDISLKAELKQHLSQQSELAANVKSVQVEMREVRDKMIELSVLTKQSMNLRRPNEP
jgi:hypothetical protein